MTFSSKGFRSLANSAPWLYLGLASLLAGVLSTSGCALTYKTPDLGELYDQAAQYHGPERRAIIVIPGVLGSKLLEEDTERVVWGAFLGGYAKPGEPDGARLLAHPMAEGKSLAELTDRVYAADVLDTIRVRMLALPLSLKAYFHMIEVLGAGGYRDENLSLAGAVDYGDDHYTCFQFPYDFRRDNVENAQRLHRFILDKRAQIRKEMKDRFGVENADVRFDVVAHSMGGLLARYYLRYGDADLGSEGPLPPITWAGSRYVERAVLVAPPNAGALEALRNLVEGRRFALLLPKYPAALLGTFPAMYQLLPRSRHQPLVWADTGEPVPDLLAPELWQEMEWGLAAPEADEVLQMLLPEVADPAERRRIALDHLRKSLTRARRFAEALDRPATPPEDLRLYLVAGDAVLTAERAEIQRPGSGENGGGRGGRKPSVRVIRKGAGDGSVLRSSALLDERLAQGSEGWLPYVQSPIEWDRNLFLFESHLGLTKDPVFTDNVLHWLLEEARSGPVVSRIYLFRHAEKAQDGTADPPLTAEGKARAQGLVQVLRSAGVTHLHSTDFRRTRQTLEPLAEATGLPIEIYDPRNLPDFATRLRETAGVHVVVGHSNTTPELVSLLGGDPVSEIDETEYDRLYLVTPATEESALFHLPSPGSQ